MEIKYIDIFEAYQIHERMLNVGGGRKGIRDFTLLHSAVERPKASFGGELLYKNIWFQAAALLQSLIKNHPFEDGNKRTGFFSTMRFLRINGYKIIAAHKQIVKFTFNVDVKRLSLNQIARWLQKNSIIYGN